MAHLSSSSALCWNVGLALTNTDDMKTKLIRLFVALALLALPALVQAQFNVTSTNTLSGLGTSAFSDPAGYPMRYYRSRSP